MNNRARVFLVSLGLFLLSFNCFAGDAWKKYHNGMSCGEARIDVEADCKPDAEGSLYNVCKSYKLNIISHKRNHSYVLPYFAPAEKEYVEKALEKRGVNDAGILSLSDFIPHTVHCVENKYLVIDYDLESGKTNNLEDVFVSYKRSPFFDLDGHFLTGAKAEELRQIVIKDSSQEGDTHPKVNINFKPSGSGAWEKHDETMSCGKVTLNVEADCRLDPKAAFYYMCKSYKLNMISHGRNHSYALPHLVPAEKEYVEKALEKKSVNESKTLSLRDLRPQTIHCVEDKYMAISYIANISAVDEPEYSLSAFNSSSFFDQNGHFVSGAKAEKLRQIVIDSSQRANPYQVGGFYPAVSINFKLSDAWERRHKTMLCGKARINIEADCKPATRGSLYYMCKPYKLHIIANKDNRTYVLPYLPQSQKKEMTKKLKAKGIKLSGIIRGGESIIPYDVTCVGGKYMVISYISGFHAVDDLQDSLFAFRSSPFFDLDGHFVTGVKAEALRQKLEKQQDTIRLYTNFLEKD